MCRLYFCLGVEDFLRFLLTLAVTVTPLVKLYLSVSPEFFCGTLKLYGALSRTSSSLRICESLSVSVSDTSGLFPSSETTPFSIGRGRVEVGDGRGRVGVGDLVAPLP